MNVSLRSNLEERIQERVRRGDYPSTEMLVQEAIERLLADDEETERLDVLLAESDASFPSESTEDVAAGIKRGLEDVNAGRISSLEDFDQFMRSKHGVSR